MYNWKKPVWKFIPLLIIFTLMGCRSDAQEVNGISVDAINETPIEEETADQPQFIEVVPDVLLFWDDFLDVNSGWDRASDESGTTDYAQGGYRILINKPTTLLWANPGLVYEDIIVEVDAALINGSEDNNYGVICRYQNADNFYAFVIGSDGDFAIRKRFEGGSLEIITGEDFEYSSSIQSGQADNHLVAKCIGDQLSFYINDTLLTQVIDADLPKGDVGLIVGSFSAAPVDVLFSNFEVYSSQ